MSVNNILNIPIFICPNDDEFEDEDTKNYLSSIADSLSELSKNNVQTQKDLELASKNITEISLAYKDIASQLEAKREIIKSLKINLEEKNSTIDFIQKETNIPKRDFYIKIREKIANVTDVIYMISRHCDAQTLLSISCLNKYFNQLCNEHIWNFVPKSSIEEYSKMLLKNDICRNSGYIDYLKEGNWTDILKVVLKIGSISIPIINFLKASYHYNNIPPDAPLITVEYTDTEGNSYFREIYDHPEYYSYSRHIALGMLSTLFPIGLVSEFIYFYFSEDGTRNRFLRRLEEVEEQTRESLKEISMFFNYISPDFFEWKIGKINDNKQKIQNFILKLENKRSQN